MKAPVTERWFALPPCTDDSALQPKARIARLWTEHPLPEEMTNHIIFFGKIMLSLES